MEGARLFQYNGPVVDAKCKAKSEASLSPEVALEVIRAAYFAGRVQITDHFRRQASARKFDLLDAGNAIREGDLRGEPEFCPQQNNWKYRLNAAIEDSRFELVVALDPSEDYSTSPVIILITGYWR